MMEQKDSLRMCMICCLSSSQTKFNDDDNPFPYKIDSSFGKFCEQLEQVTVSSLSSPSLSGFSTNSIFKSLDDNHHNDDRQCSLSICGSCAKYLNEAVRRRHKAELLERLVVNLQKQLLKALKDLQLGMDGYYEEMNKIAEKVKGSDEFHLVKTCFKQKRTWKKRAKPNGVVLFREAIVNVTSDLKGYRENLNERFPPPPLLKTGKQSVSEELITFDDNLISFVSDVTPDPDEDEAKIKIEVMDNDEDQYFLDDDNNNEDGFKFESDNDNASDYSPPPEPAKKPPPIKNKKQLKLKQKIANVDQFSPFRRRLVSRIINRKDYRENHEVDDDHSDSTSNFTYYLKLKRDYLMTYDQTTGTCSIGHVEIQINDNDTPETIECTLCGYQSKAQGLTKKKEVYMDRAMWNHILGKHLLLFKCTHCPKSCATLMNLREHLKGHRDNIFCKICQKPIPTKRQLITHEWSHLSEQEKIDKEIEEGVKRPYPKGEVGLFICSSCAKTFKRRKDLNQHQITHEPVRDKVLCPDCGKFFISKGYYLKSHKNKCAIKIQKPTKRRLKVKQQLFQNKS